MSKGNGSRPQPVLRVLEGQEAKAYIAKQRKQAAVDFKDWKKELCNIINNQSRLVFNKDGSYQFILPSRLVKLVWSTTIQERIKAIMAGGGVELEDAKGQAIARLRDEMDDAYKEFTGEDEQEEKQSEEDAAKAEQEEREASETLARLRAEMIKNRDGE